MSVKKDSKTQLIELCQGMWLFFTPYNFNEDKGIAEKNLACYDLIVKLTLLSWNTALVKSSFSAVEKTLELINLRAYNGSEFTEDVLHLAAERAWEDSRRDLEYFAFAEAVLTDGKAEIRVYRENEAVGMGIRFEEFRKMMKKDNSGRSIACLLAERFDAGPEKSVLLKYENPANCPVYDELEDFTESLYDAYDFIYLPESDKDSDVIMKIIREMEPGLWEIGKLCLNYEDVITYIPEKYRTELFQVSNDIECEIRSAFHFAVGIEILYGHDDVVNDWNHLLELTMQYIPEACRNLADNILSEIWNAMKAKRMPTDAELKR